MNSTQFTENIISGVLALDSNTVASFGSFITALLIFVRTYKVWGAVRLLINRRKEVQVRSQEAEKERILKLVASILDAGAPGSDSEESFEQRMTHRIARKRRHRHKDLPTADEGENKV